LSFPVELKVTCRDFCYGRRSTCITVVNRYLPEASFDIPTSALAGVVDNIYYANQGR